MKDLREAPLVRILFTSALLYVVTPTVNGIRAKRKSPLGKLLPDCVATEPRPLEARRGVPTLEITTPLLIFVDSPQAERVAAFYFWRVGNTLLSTTPLPAAQYHRRLF